MMQELHQQGAKTLMIFNIPPLGCYPAFLASLASRNLSTFDSRGCLTTLNEAVQSTNVLVKAGLKALSNKYPDATFINADLYGFLDAVLNNPADYGELCVVFPSTKPSIYLLFREKKKIVVGETSSVGGCLSVHLV
jgi:phospholipase/lecithinase/hemolysin